MELHTASEVISLAKKLEEDGARFYQGLAQSDIKEKETWLSFAQENRKNIVQIERAYYEVITDAIESGFSFSISPEEYTSKIELAEDAKYSDVLVQAVVMEEKTTKFCIDAAEQAKSLLADVPRAFTMVTKKRSNRKPKLEAFLQGEA